MLRFCSPRILIPSFIVLFWLAMMTWLAKKEIFAPTVPSVPATADRPIDSWLGVNLADNQPVGFVHFSVRPESRGPIEGSRLRLDARLTMAVLGPAMEIDVDGGAWIEKATGAGSVSLDISSAGEHSLRLDGRMAHGMLDGSLQTVGHTIPVHFPVSDGLDLLTGAGVNLNAAAMQVGSEYQVDSLDPSTFAAAKARIRCVGEEVRSVLGAQVPTKVVAVNSGGMAIKMWVSKDDEVVRAELPFGFVLEKTTPEDALRRSSGSPATDLISKSAIVPTGKPIGRGASRLVARISGIDPGVSVPSDDTQHYGDDGVLTVESRREPQGVLPVAEHDSAFARDLQSDPLIQSDAPEIVEQAKQIIGDGTDRWRAALALYEWVYQSLDKKMVFSVPSALDVLASREGDCNEHTTLFVALARAAGIPSRIAIGLVWSDEYQGFYYHAWPEVYVGAWIWVDPTLGQPIADATHIKLLNGTITEWGKLLAFVGKANIEVIEVQ